MFLGDNSIIVEYILFMIGHFISACEQRSASKGRFCRSCQNLYKATIHVYGPEKIAKLRLQVGVSVEKLVKALDADLEALGNRLQEINREKNMFAVLYAYVLHGYAMNQFGEEIYRKPQLSEKHPFWNGFAGYEELTRYGHASPSSHVHPL